MDNFGPQARQFFLEHPDWKPSIDSGCPIGWDNILSDALRELLALSVRRGARISIVQVKEKFAELRIYFRVSGERPQIYFDIRGADTRISGKYPPARAESVSAEAMAITNRASERSRQVCDVCGRPGAVRQGGWLRVFCDQHAPADDPE